MVKGREFLIQNLNFESKTAHAVPSKLDYYTTCRDITDIEPQQVFQTISHPFNSTNANVSYGILHVETRVIGYYKMQKHTGAKIETVSLQLPPMCKIGHGVWLDLPEDATAALKTFMSTKFDDMTIPSTAHTINHIIKEVTPLFLQCDRGDLATEHHAPEATRKRYICTNHYLSKKLTCALVQHEFFLWSPSLVGLALRRMYFQDFLRFAFT